MAGLESVTPGVLAAVNAQNAKIGRFEQNIRTFWKAGIDLDVG